MTGNEQIAPVWNVTDESRMCGFLSFQYVERRFELNPVPSFLTYGDVECEDTDKGIA